MTAFHWSEGVSIGLTHVFCSLKGAQKFVENELVAQEGTRDSNNIKVLNGRRAYWNNYKCCFCCRYSALYFFRMKKPILVLWRCAVLLFLLVMGHQMMEIQMFFSDVLKLATDFGVTCHAIPIKDNSKDDATLSTRKYYQKNLVTPSKIKYVDKDIYGTIPIGVIPGVYAPADSFKKVQSAIVQVLKMGGF